MIVSDSPLFQKYPIRGPEIVVEACRSSAKVRSKFEDGRRPGKVIAVFDRSLLVKVDGAFLIHIGSLSSSLTPRSVLVGEHDFHCCIHPILRPDDSVLVGVDRIDWMESPLRIETRGAEVVCLRVPGNIEPLPGEIIRRNGISP